MTEEANWKRLLKSRLLFRPPVLSDPRLLKRGSKAIVLICIGLCASTSGFSSTIYFPGKFLMNTTEIYKLFNHSFRIAFYYCWFKCTCYCHNIDSRFVCFINGYCTCVLGITFWFLSSSSYLTHAFHVDFCSSIHRISFYQQYLGSCCTPLCSICRCFLWAICWRR